MLDERRSAPPIGRRGLTLNLFEKGAQTTVELPGTGLSYRSRRVPLGDGVGATADDAGPSAWPLLLLLLAVVVAILIAVFG